MIDHHNATLAEARAELARLRDLQTQSTPGESEQLIDAYAWCVKPLCEGSGQRPIKAIKKTIVETLGMLGAANSVHEQNSVVNSRSYVRFADAADAVCQVCGGPADCGDQLRPEIGVDFGGSEALLRVRRTGQGGATRESVLAAAADAKTRPPTPREALDMKFVQGKVDEAEYLRKLEVLGEPIPDALKAV